MSIDKKTLKERFYNLQKESLDNVIRRMNRLMNILRIAGLGTRQPTDRTTLDKEKPGIKSLTDYHRQRSKAASLAVEEMLKRPLSQKEAKEQVARLNNGQETKEEYHKKMKPVKEAYDKVVQEMLKQPTSFEQAKKEQANLREMRNKQPSTNESEHPTMNQDNPRLH